MENIMTIADIQSQFPSEWVLVEDPRTNETLEVQESKVKAHSKNRDEAYRLAASSHPKHFAILYTGTPQKDTAIAV